MTGLIGEGEYSLVPEGARPSVPSLEHYLLEQAVTFPGIAGSEVVFLGDFHCSMYALMAFRSRPLDLVLDAWYREYFDFLDSLGLLTEFVHCPGLECGVPVICPSVPSASLLWPEGARALGWPVGETFRPLPLIPLALDHRLLK
jgi:hypothetical protein